MRTNDQYFQPGDKVMLVKRELPPRAFVLPDKGEKPQSGKVYCVEDFWEGPTHNTVMLVGMGGWRYAGGMKVGWAARNFRKVDEIKLCIAAVECLKTPVEANQKQHP